MPSCPRLFEVEAMRDGRLAGAELASFERHMASCSACAREARELETLARSLRASSSSGPDDLHVRRERTRLLAAFDRTLVAPERRWSPWRLRLVPAVFILLAGVLLVLWRARPPEQLAAAPTVTVRGDGAIWSERAQSGTKELVLERGTLWIRVDSSTRAGRLLVLLPDGELEDTGTTFTVSAEHGKTTRVAVEEGSVILRIRGQTPVVIEAGKAWPFEPPPTTPVHARSAAPVEAVPSAAPPPPARSAPSPRAPTSAPAASAPAGDPSADFRAAMALLNAGSAEAAGAFGRFLAEHPRDPRAEDAAYLRIIAFQRSGDSAATKGAALAYLRRYPKGFRRAEAEQLSR
jgi:hypothetical protein